MAWDNTGHHETKYSRTLATTADSARPFEIDILGIFKKTAFFFCTSKNPWSNKSALEILKVSDTRW